MRAKPHRMDRAARSFAWFLLGLSVVIFVAAVALLLLVPKSALGSNFDGSDYLIGFILLFYSVLGALIAARHPRNPIGWLFITMGLASELHILPIGYLIYANYHNPSSIQFALLIFSLLVNPFILPRVLGPLGLLVFPDGRLMSPRWRIIAWLPVGIGVIWYLSSTARPVAGLPTSLSHPLLQSILPSIGSAVAQGIASVAAALIEMFFVIATVGIAIRLRKASGDQREQLKWFVYAAVIGASITLGLTILDYTPLYQGLMSGSPSAVTRILSLLPEVAYLLIPLAAFIAIYKNHLYDIDLIINRTLVYIPLTAILAGLYAASVTLLQRLFIASTGSKSDAAVVMSTLILAATFTPIKNSLQSWVDKRFREPQDPLKELKAFGKQVESVAHVINPRHATRQLMEISMAAFHASCGAIYLKHDGAMMLEHASRDWKEGRGVVNMLLVQNGEQLGVLVLGARIDHKGYSAQDQKMLQREVDRVAEMVWLAQSLGQEGQSIDGRQYGSSDE